MEEAIKYKLTKPVYLIGFMGAGKSSVGKYFAKRNHLQMLDADKYLENQEGRIIADIFAEDGEDYFRDLETKYLLELSQEPRLICTGGGVIKREDNLRIMKEHGFAIYLSVTAEAAAARIKDASSRPLFKNLETAKKTIAERAPLYEAAADVTVDTVDRSVKRISSEVFHLLLEQNVLVRVQ